MRLNKLFLISLFLVILISLSVNAIYPQIGYNDYIQEEGIFNTALETATSSRSIYLLDPKNIPLVDDLDKDGVNEIIIQDGNSFQIFRNESLDALTSLTIGGNGNAYSNVNILDIDNDGMDEIIVLSEISPTSVYLYVIGFNNSVLSVNKVVTNAFANPYYNGGDLMLGCDYVNFKCLLFATYSKQFYTSTSAHIQIKGYDGLTESLTSSLGTDANRGLNCFSKLKNVEVKDNDGDGTIEYTYTSYRGSDLSDDVVRLQTLRYGNPPVVELTSGDTHTFESEFPYGTGQYCNQTIYVGDYEVLPENTFSSPLVMNFDGNSNNGLERVFGVITGTGNDPDFKLVAYQGKNNDEFDYYPKIFNAKGYIISNPFRADVFKVSGDTDICIMGYYDIDDTKELDVLCASPFIEGFFGLGKSVEWVYDVSGDFDLDTSYKSKHLITHSSQQDRGNSFDGKDTTEVISSYGIFQFTEELNAVFTRKLKRVFNNPINQSGIMLMVNVKNEEYSDMLLMTNTNLYYYDDSYVNSPAYISNYEINPCVEQTIKVNETMTVLVTAKNERDTETDMVRARVTAYYQDTNEQAYNWTSYVNDGTALSFQFDINKTGNAFKIKMEVNDIENPDQIDTIIRTFNVNTFGVERGDCITNVDINSPLISEGEEDIVTEGTGKDTNLEDNVVTNLLKYFAEETGLGSGILFLLIIALVVWSIAQAEAESSKRHGTHFNMTGVIVYSLIACFILLVIGVFLGLISYSIVMIIIVVLIFALSMMFRHLFTGSRM